MRGRSKKQRSGSRPAAAPVDEDVAVRRAASVKAIKTWDDVEHDSADDFDHSRDKVLVGYDRRLAKHDGSSDFDSDEEVLRVGAAASSESDASDSGDDDDAQAADGAWGSHKANYYNADDIGTDTDDDEAAAKEEEEEALRLQKRQLADLDEADFIDDFSTQLGVSSTADDRRSAARLVAAVDDSHAQIDLAADDSFDLSSAKRAALERLPEKEKLRVIEAEAPELLSLAADVESHWITVRCEIKPVLDRATALGVRADDHPALAFYTAKFQLLMSYLNNIAVYLVMKASTADERGHVELRDHPVIATIVEFRRRLALMDALQERLAPLLALFADELEAGVFTAAADPVPIADELPAAEAPSKRSKKIKPTKPSKGTTADNRPFLQGAPPVADSYAELQAMLRRERGTKSRQPAAALDDADLGEADQLDADDVDDKARASRRLRHHAKRITQARAKRGGRDALSGDADVPYKDRRSQQQQQQQSHYNAGDADLGS
ncbi:something about silencing protein 10, partial [Coemansia thaxteri]